MHSFPMNIKKKLRHVKRLFPIYFLKFLKTQASLRKCYGKIN